MEEEAGDWKKFKNYLRKFRKFQFFSSDKKELFLINLVVADVKKKYEKMKESYMGTVQTLNKQFLSKELINVKSLENMVKDIKELRDTIRAEVSAKKRAGLPIEKEFL